MGADPTTATKRCPRCNEEISSVATKCKHCGSELAPSSELEAIGATLRRYSTLTIALVTFLFVVFQVARVSGYEVNTVVAILKGTSFATIVIGVLVAQLPLFVFMLLLASSWLMVAAADTRTAARAGDRRGAVAGAPAEAGAATPRSSQLDARWVPALPLAALLLVGFFGMVWPLFVIGLSFAAFSVIRALRPPTRAHPTWFRRAVVLAAGLTVFLMLLRVSIWLPIEVVDTSDRGRLLAYVVDDEGGWTTLLTPGHRLIREESGMIVSREVCALESLDTQLFSQIFRLRPAQLVDAAYHGRIPKALTPPCPQTE